MKVVATSFWAKSATSILGMSTTGKAVVLISLLGALGTGSYLITAGLVRSSPEPVSRSSTQTNASFPSRGFVEQAHKEEPEAALATDSADVPTRQTPTASSKRQTSMGHEIEDAPELQERVSANSESPNVAAFEELTIADEAKLLEGARSALSANPAQALQIVGTHQRLYPDGQLSAEGELIAVDALLRLGRRQEAEQRAAPRLAHNPNSLYAKRLRQLLASGNP